MNEATELDEVPSEQMRDFCQFVLSQSSFRFEPGANIPVHAPEVAAMMSQGPSGWEIKFAESHFLIEVAIRRLWHALFKSSQAPGAEEIASCIRGAVADAKHQEYESQWDLTGEFMVFGVQGISVIQFSQAFANRVSGRKAT